MYDVALTLYGEEKVTNGGDDISSPPSGTFLSYALPDRPTPLPHPAPPHLNMIKTVVPNGVVFSFIYILVGVLGVADDVISLLYNQIAICQFDM